MGVLFFAFVFVLVLVLGCLIGLVLNYIFGEGTF